MLLANKLQHQHGSSTTPAAAAAAAAANFAEVNLHLDIIASTAARTLLPCLCMRSMRCAAHEPLNT
jgi:hypothetical protein